MMKQEKGKRICIFTFLFAFVCLFSFFCPLANSQLSQLVVQKTEPVLRGIDLADRVDMESIGYLSLVQVEPLGRIDSVLTSDKMLISAGDEIFVDFGSTKDVKPGETFSIGHTSELIRHPITNKPFGYLVSIRGTLTVKEHVKDGTYLAGVGKTFAEVFVDDIVVPHQLIGSCLQPMPADPKLYGNIIAIDDNREVIGKFTIVYLDGGFKDGIQTGSTFDVVSLHKRPILEFNRYPLEDISKDVIDVLGKEAYLDDFMRKITEGKTIYEYSVGKLLVIDAKPDTAIGVVLSGKEELAPGAFIKGMPWVEPPDFLASLPACAVK
jgi:hypothetical protein